MKWCIMQRLRFGSFTRWVIKKIHALYDVPLKLKFSFAIVLCSFLSSVKLHSVNKILLKKAQDSKVQVASLEEGFQRLQQSFRETALESLENEKKLHDEISALQSVIDALTSYEEQYNNAEFPECYLNFTLRGKGKGRTSSDKNNKVGKKEVDSSIPQRQQFAFFKRSRNRRVVASKQPVIKFYRRSRKRGTSLGGANKSKMIAIQRRKVTLILFEGRELFYSVLSGMV